MFSTVSGWFRGIKSDDETAPETVSEEQGQSNKEKPNETTSSQAKAEDAASKEPSGEPVSDQGSEKKESPEPAKEGVDDPAAGIQLDLNEVSEKAIHAAKEWGSYLFSVGKVATKTVASTAASTAKQIKHTVEEKTILGDFSKEQERFVNEKKEKQRLSDAAVPPWVGYNEEEAMKTQILALSTDKRNFLRNPPTGVQFNFDYDMVFPVAMATLQEDPNLQKMRFDLVPKQMKEENFWRNYFYRVSLIKQSTQLTSLAQQTGSTGEGLAVKSSDSSRRSSTDSGQKDDNSSTEYDKLSDVQDAFSAQNQDGPSILQKEGEEDLPMSSPTQEAEFISDAYQTDLNEDDLRKEMEQMGFKEDKQTAEDDVDGDVEDLEVDPDVEDWEKELMDEILESEK
ncbi:synapse-associated protein 1 isoform X2 [Lingula anatina]|uniref:Synapse-associated protein 1 isoform X2 n=1 Tax=Lingula anatina TaxID=7574 RepID=A0A1S3JXJ4_LINAN|nr:synapse-associated protein 1 isoform X2 [Lingula anatina]|eukprot:XP_013414769.1 synapse-associated protein 1 isoform X2 [Lingula anatina]